MVLSVKSSGLDLPICDALWAGETSSSCSICRLLGLALPDVVVGGMEFARFRFEGRDDVSDYGGVGGKRVSMMAECNQERTNSREEGEAIEDEETRCGRNTAAGHCIAYLSHFNVFARVG
jgi:hypothetical protein